MFISKMYERNLYSLSPYCFLRIDGIDRKCLSRKLAAQIEHGATCAKHSEYEQSKRGNLVWSSERTISVTNA